MEQLSLWSMALCLITVCIFNVQAAMDLPKFRQMVLLYPGYYLHGGRYRDRDVINMIGGLTTNAHLHNTASLRLSWTLNRLGGQHAIGKNPVNLSKHGHDSYTGKDGQQYIFRNTAYGPFLAARYGNPLVARSSFATNGGTQTGKDSSARSIMADFRRKQGIVRLVSYRGSHAGGHVALWNCGRFVQSRDWTTETHIISAEFWEAPDSYCPPEGRSTPSPQLVKVSISPSLLASELHLSHLAEVSRTKQHHHRQRSLSDLIVRHQGHRQGHRRYHENQGKR